MRAHRLVLACLIAVLVGAAGCTPAYFEGHSPDGRRPGTPRSGVVVVNPAAWPGSPTCGIQESIALLPDAGGVVFIPRGTYVVRRSISLRSGVTLRGEGPATVLTRPAPLYFELTAVSPADRMEAALSAADGLRAGDEIWFQDQAQSGYDSRHLELRTVNGRNVTGALIAGDAARSYAPENGAWGGNFFPMIMIAGNAEIPIEGQTTGGAPAVTRIKFSVMENVAIEALTIDGGAYPYDAGRIPDFTCAAIHSFNVENLSVRDVTVRRWPGDGIGAQGGSATVTGCLVEDGLGNGFHPGTNIHRSLWTNNVARRNGWDGFFFCLGVRNAVVANNVFSDNHRNGIGHLQNPNAYNVITGNVIARNGRCGISALRSVGDVITGNLIQDNSQVCPGAFAGIQLEAHSADVVTGNSCLDTQKKPTQITGIESLDPAGENLIAGNFTPAYPATPAVLPPKGELRPAAAPPKLDGSLDDAAWKGADWLAIDRLAEDASPVAAKAQAAFLHDDRFLYVGVRCNEPRMDRLRDKLRKRGEDVWAENDVEIFVMPDPQSGRCCQFVINSLGTIFELQYDGAKEIAWDSKGTAAVQRDKDSWSAEVAIPLEALGVKELKPGQMWRANVCRARLTWYPRELTAWSPTFGAFYVPRRFGTLTMKP